jgi:hypothetical protein
MHPYFIFKLRRFGILTHPTPNQGELGGSCVMGSGTSYLGT